MKKDSLFWLLLALTFLFWLGMALNGYNVVGNDTIEHLKMVNNISYTPDYAPLFRWFSQPFSTQPNIWNFFTMFLLIVPCCVLLYRITGEKLVPVFYFCLSNFFYFFMAGLFTQLLVFVFILALFNFKNQYVRLGLLFVGCLIHSQAFFILPVTWFFILLEENKDIFVKVYKKVFKFKWVLGAVCSPIWGDKQPEQVTQIVVQQTYANHSLSVNDFFSFFIKIVPFPFLFIALKYFWVNRRIDWFALFFTGFFGGFVFGSRVWYLCALVVLTGFCFAWKDLQYKRWWIVFILIYGVFLFEQFVALRVFCL